MRFAIYVEYLSIVYLASILISSYQESMGKTEVIFRFPVDENQNGVIFAGICLISKTARMITNRHCTVNLITFVDQKTKLFELIIQKYNISHYDTIIYKH